MGYRSDVGLVLNKKANQLFNEALAKETTHIQNWVNNLLLEADKDCIAEDGCRLLIWNQIKWYYDPDIEFIEKFLETLSEEDYYYIQIGESLDDCTIDGFFYANPFSLDVVRKLTYTDKC